MTTPALSPLQVVSLVKAVPEKVLDAAKSALAPGEHAVDLTVRVHGTVKRGEDSARAGVSRYLSKRFLALTLKYSGVTANAALAAMERALAEAGGPVGEEEGSEEERAALDALFAQVGVRAFEERLAAQSAAHPITVRGRITARLAVERVPSAEEATGADLAG